MTRPNTLTVDRQIASTAQQLADPHAWRGGDHNKHGSSFAYESVEF